MSEHRHAVMVVAHEHGGPSHEHRWLTDLDARERYAGAAHEEQGLDPARLARAMTVVALIDNYNGLLPKFQFASGPGTLADALAREYAATHAPTTEEPR